MTVTLKPKSEITVPKSIRRKAGIKAGDRFEFSVSGRVITILPKPPVAHDDYTPAQRREIDARLAKSDEDILAGRVYGPFTSAAKMAASIEANIRKLRAAKPKAQR
jgi:AbrB family looped-hinge helix DNA binding protein